MVQPRWVVRLALLGALVLLVQVLSALSGALTMGTWSSEDRKWCLRQCAAVGVPDLRSRCLSRCVEEASKRGMTLR